MLKRRVLVLICVLLGWSLSWACRPEAPPTEETSAEAQVESGQTDTALADKPSPPEQAIQETTPEPAPIEQPARPDPRPVDEGPVVPEKVLINGIHGTIVHVTDGDTMYVVKKPGGWASRVRIKGLAAPECHKKQSTGSSFQECDADSEYFGLGSYEIAKALALGTFRKILIKCVEVNNECEQDDFGRYLAYLELEDGTDLGETIIRAGGGWSFTRYDAKKLPAYCRAEADAIKEKKGMWVKARSSVKLGMSKDSVSWYYHKTTSLSHDGICSKLMGESFVKRAGE